MTPFTSVSSMFPPPLALSKSCTLFQLHFPVNMVNGFRSACIAGLVASFPGSSTPEYEIELLHAERYIFVFWGSLGTRLLALICNLIPRPSVCNNLGMRQVQHILLHLQLPPPVDCYIQQTCIVANKGLHVRELFELCRKQG